MLEETVLALPTLRGRHLTRTFGEGETPAEELLGKFYGPWGGVVDPVFAEYAY